MKGDDIIALLGLTSEDAKVKGFLANCGITKQPKLKRGDQDAYLENLKMGLELVFRDERYLDVKSQAYPDGALVLWSVTMYGDDVNFQKFSGGLPHGLKFDFGSKEADATLGKKRAWEDKTTAEARWDFKAYCVFLAFDKKSKNIKNVAVQLPVA